MIYRTKNEQLKGISLKFYRKIQSILRNEKGQTLVEYSLLLAISNSIANLLDNPFIVIFIIVLIVSLLIWKPNFSTVLFIALILAILLFLRRWAEYGHF